MTEFICPTHPDIHQSEAGSCPKCGMALEPETGSAPVTHSRYTCPMHPEIVRDQPGNCPICGMILEPMTVTVEESNPELARMTRRLWVGIGFTIPLLAIMILDLVPSHPIQHLLAGRSLGWVEFVFATPVVLWGGWQFFERGWTSIVSRHLNMFTLISIGAGSAYLYSVVAVFLPELFPASFRDISGQLGPDGSFALSEVERGEHSLTLQVTNARGEVICQANAVSFSIRQRNAAVPGAPTVPGAPLAPRAPGVGVVH